MSDSLFDQLKARGEGFLTEISNNLMANPAFMFVAAITPRPIASAVRSTAENAPATTLLSVA